MGYKRINIIKVKEQLERARKKKEFLQPLVDHYLILGRHQDQNYSLILGIYSAYCQEEAEALDQLDMLKKRKERATKQSKTSNNRAKQ